MIIDPISSSRMRVRSQKEFLAGVYGKYGFLKDLDMTNVVLAGGFCRSILLKQEMKDFDFFFYGLGKEQDQNQDQKSQFEQRLDKLIRDLVNNVRKYYVSFKKNVKFGIFFKPMFNVVELICFEDPSNHITDKFTLDDFHKYKYKSLRRYTGEARDIPANDKTDNSDKVYDTQTLACESTKPAENDKVSDPDEPDYSDDNSDSSDKSDDSDDKDDLDCYFEDGDRTGIKMLHRFQFILCKYATKFDITQSFDMFPSKVLFDGDRLYFTQKALIAYKYMINEIMLDGGSELFKHRITKYFNYGFSIVFPPNNRNWSDKNYDNKYDTNDPNRFYDGEDQNKGPVIFKVRKMIDNLIIISHNSNMEKMLERNEELEKTQLNEGKGLYVSSLFCSFVSILRYVRINGIDYVFPQLPQFVFDEATTTTTSNVTDITPNTNTMTDMMINKTSDMMNDTTSNKIADTTTNNIANVNDINSDQLHFTTDGIRFKHRTLKVEFKDRFDTLYKTRDWYTGFYTYLRLLDHE